MTKHLVQTYTAQQVRQAEVPLLEAGVPLMSRAAHALAQVCAEYQAARILVLVGSGNNGGDALYAAADLAEDGAEVVIIPVGSRWHEDGMSAARKKGASVLRPQDFLAEFPGRFELIIDGILGTGTSGVPGLRGTAREIVEFLTAGPNAQVPVVAVDIPSGIDPNTGQSAAPILNAEQTVTFGGVKSGLVTAPGSKVSGRIVLAPIGLERALHDFVPVGQAEISRIVDSESTL